MLLLGELLASLGVDPASADAAPLLQLVKRLTTGGEIEPGAKSSTSICIR